MRKMDRRSGVARGARWRWAALAPLASLLVLAPAANAGKNTLAGGDTVLTPKKGITKALDRFDVKVRTVKPAKATAEGIVFPITGGKLAADGSAGIVKHAGALRLGGGHEKLTLRRPVAKLNSNPKLTVKVGGNRIKLLKLKTNGAKVSRNGFGTEIKRVKGKLSGIAAKVLHDLYGLPVKKGTPFGKLTITAEPETVQLASEVDTTLALDQGAVDALSSLGISAAPIGPATAGPGGLAFPITGGKVNLADLSGKIRHSGGISLSKDGTVVDLTKFTIVLDGDPDLTAIVGGQRVSILSLDLSNAAVDVSGRQIEVGGVEARLTAAAAEALNAAFSTTAFTEGFLLGTAAVDAIAE